MDKTILDNLSGQELKGMIDDEVITLEELDNTALGKIMDFEINMLCFDSGDMITIRRCSKLLEERNPHDELDDDKFISIIRRAKKEHVIIIDEKTSDNKAKVIKRKHALFRRIGLVAAILCLIVATTTLIAAAFGVNIFEYISEFVRKDDNSVVHINGITFHNGGEAKRYSSVQEMVELEKLNIMYPSKLPDGINISSVIVNKDERGNDLIHISTNNANIYIAIETNFNIPDISSDNCTIYDHNGLTYYIFQENTFFATCLYKNCCYSIQANNYDELIYIIDNMKE